MLWSNLVFLTCSVSRARGVLTTYSQAVVPSSRVDRPHALARNIWARDPDTGELVLLNRAEEHEFWAWALIEVLRHTGIRVEELHQLTHHNLVQYRLPSTGELGPLLQFASSKTDASGCC